MNEKVKEVIDFFGTQGKTAKALGCTQATVFKWLHGQMNMTAIFALKAESLTQGKVKAVDLCPRLAEVITQNKTPSGN